MKLAAQTFWRMPGNFGVARMFGPSYSLRSVVFHDISRQVSPFTKGMNVSTTPAKLEAALKFFAQHYTPVRLEDVLTNSDGRGLPDRAILVTFDDAYASVAELAAPLCKRFGVPAVFFVNAAFLDNRRLAPDNLVCYVANTRGLEAIRAAARLALGVDAPSPESLSDVFVRLFPQLSLAKRSAFLDALRAVAHIREEEIAEEARLYLTSKQLSSLASIDFEIGNHTFAHVHCRSLSPEEIESQVGRNQSELEAIVGRKVRAFSQPYGSSEDLTIELTRFLERTGHEAVFLSESVANERDANPFHLDRVGSHAGSDDALFFEIEVLPRLRAVRNRLRRSSSASRAQNAAMRREHALHGEKNIA
ncbi:MAG: polysaccharide deacetylase family protein [Acidobacteriota bacterium]|nr:polysaccharide deacetylase family protein [Acidobacteriota bacterium]